MDVNLIGAALFVALLVVKKNAPFNVSAMIRSTGLTVFNCVLCAYGWVVLSLFAVSFYFGSYEVFRVAIQAMAYVGYGWVMLALIGLASWDN